MSRYQTDPLSSTLPPKWLSILRGSQIELVLQSSRFLFRPLELPKRAAEYLEGIVRSQIDRLTPWTANEAVYSWTPPTDAPNDRINLTIAATARSMVAPYLRAIDKSKCRINRGDYSAVELEHSGRSDKAS